MIKARKHRPNFVDSSTEIESCEVESTEQLLDVDWLKKYAEWDEYHNFCQSKDGKLLMIENEDGSWWWVAAHLTAGKTDLPVVRMNKGDSR